MQKRFKRATFRHLPKLSKDGAFNPQCMANQGWLRQCLEEKWNNAVCEGKYGWVTPGCGYHSNWDPVKSGGWPQHCQPHPIQAFKAAVDQKAADCRLMARCERRWLYRSLTSPTEKFRPNFPVKRTDLLPLPL